MTLPWEDDPRDAPLVMGAGQLAAVISNLFADSRRDGQPHAHVCGHGLQLTIGTAKGDVIVLSRKDGEPGVEEARTTAAQAGWAQYSTEWRVVQGLRSLLIRPDHTAPEDVPAPPPLDPDPPDEVIRALLDAPGPWREASLSLRDPAEGRRQVLANFRRFQLRDFLAWARQHWPDRVARTLLDHQLAQDRARLREAIR